MEVAKAIMTTPWHDAMTEHKYICVTLFIYYISLKPISNNLVGKDNLVSVVYLKPNCLFISLHAVPSIP